MYNLQGFDERYAQQGGSIALQRMMKEKRTLEFIANHFGVTKQGIKYIIESIFEKKYDPRADRKEEILCKLIEYAKTHTEQELREAYFYSEYYLQLAIQECYSRGIYK